MNLQDVLVTLPSLRAEELTQIRAACDLLLGSSKVSENTDVVRLFDAAREVVGEHRSYGAFLKSVPGRAWREAAPLAVSWLAGVMPVSVQAEQVAVYRFALGVLVEDMKGRGVPISLASVAQNLGRLTLVLKSQFPGYLESGLGPKILAALGIKT